ncbi:hypothetical protein [Pseudoteredinibacter isoporae]|uniref:hypothetical protein n=1 Tax=Pseudoteredinibacter isoporae TaxID=570281 RepID=UPI003104B066
MSIEFKEGDFKIDFIVIAMSSVGNDEKQAHEYAVGEISRCLKLSLRFMQSDCRAMSDIYQYWAKEWRAVAHELSAPAPKCEVVQ